jgi:hypothetical protein
MSRLISTSTGLRHRLVRVVTAASLLASVAVVAVAGAASAGTGTQIVVTTQPSAGEISGTALAQQPVVSVEDSNNVVDTTATGTVTASTSSTGCSVSAGSTATITSGVATFSGLTLTGTSGTSCVITFASGTFTSVPSNAIVMSGAATQIVVSTQPSSGFSGTALATQPAITIEDGSNHTVVADNSTTVTATITAPGTGTLSHSTATAVNGVATFSGLTLTALAGQYTLTFSSGTFTSVPSTTFTINFGAPSKLAILTQPSATVQSGVALTPQPVIEIEDSAGNYVTTSNLAVTATLTSGGGTLSNFNATASSGQATFSGLALNTLVGSYTLTFSSSGLTPAVSNLITVSIGPASQLAITTQPSASVATGVAFPQQPVVKIEDAGGDVVSNYSTVTATLTSGTGTLSHNTANAVAGTATFSGLTLTASVGTYTLTFSDPGFPSVVSAPFSISSGAASKLVITVAPSTTTQSGVALVVQPTVTVEDAAGNVVTSDSSTVTARITSGGVSLTNGAKTAVAGVAAFSGLAINALAGTYTLTFTDGTLTAAVTASISVSAGPATKLVVTQEPSPVAASGVALAVQPVVKVEDSGGNVVTSVNSGQAIAAIGVGTGGTVTASPTANFVYGVAAFSGLAITGTPGGQYQLVFTGNGFSVLDTAKITLGLAQAPLSIRQTKGWLGRSLSLTVVGGSGTGAVTLAVMSAGTAGCAIQGNVLSYARLGTCVVVATKAASGNYQPVSSSPTTITIALLPKPPVLTLGFSPVAFNLNAGQARAIAVLASRLTTRSLVRIVAYAPRNVPLARARALAVEHFLTSRVHVRVQLILSTHTGARMVQLITLSQ